MTEDGGGSEAGGGDNSVVMTSSFVRQSAFTNRHLVLDMVRFIAVCITLGFLMVFYK